MKKKFNIDTGEWLDYNTYEYGGDDYTIDNVIDALNKSKLAGATHVKFSGSAYDSDVSSVYLQGFYIKEETDWDYHKRLEDEAWSLEAEKIKELREEEALYNELKRKFEGK